MYMMGFAISGMLALALKIGMGVWGAGEIFKAYGNIQRALGGKGTPEQEAQLAQIQASVDVEQYKADGMKELQRYMEKEAKSSGEDLQFQQELQPQRELKNFLMQKALSMPKPEEVGMMGMATANQLQAPPLVGSSMQPFDPQIPISALPLGGM